MEAKKRLAPLLREQQQRNEEIADLRELIRANANLLPDVERRLELVQLEFLKFPTNITEAVRLAIFGASIAEQKVNPIEIKALVEYSGFDFSEYSNPMASIHTILKRMKETNKVDYDETVDGFWFSDIAAAAAEGDLINPQILTDFYVAAGNALAATNKPEVMEIMKATASHTLHNITTKNRRK